MINDLKDLKALFKLCRAQGITDFKMNGIEIKLGEMPVLRGTQQESQGEESESNPYAGFPQGTLTEEQLIFYSSGGKPQDDPQNKEAI